MPELPEVETVINILKPLVVNKTISDYTIFYNRLIQSDIEDFKNIKNKTILSITRFGKFIFFHLSDNYCLITHLRMEGKFRYLTSKNIIKSTTLIFTFSDSTYLSFDDTRKFGLMYLTKEEDVKNVKMISSLGIEANNVKDTDYEKIINKIITKNKPIKELLLDQSIMCGIGNIYADEILFASKINPLTKGKELSSDNIITIIKNSKVILDRAIKEGGSTIHSFHPSEGVDGRFQVLLKAYGRNDKPCINCGTRMHKIFLNGRGTTFCPNCQIDYSLKKAIGITGPIGSGKSTVLKHLASLNYKTISSDDIVHSLYKEENVKRKISGLLHMNFDYFDPISKEKARNIMINNKEIKRNVEQYIYKVLEEKLIEEIKTSNLIAIEVPLLFKAHFEYMFKKIFVIEVSKEKQIENLNCRNEYKIEDKLKLNNDYHYLLNDDVIVIKNNSSLDELFKQIDSNL